MPSVWETNKLKSNVSDQHMAADFTFYTIKALNMIRKGFALIQECNRDAGHSIHCTFEKF